MRSKRDEWKVIGIDGKQIAVHPAYKLQPNEWNNLPDDVKNAESILSFKRRINSDRPTPNPLFAYGERRSQTLHTRLRTHCSSLNEHLFRRNIVTSPLCLCGLRETTSHFFLECTQYAHIRGEVIYKISIYSAPCIETILYGDDTHEYLTNTKIADAVHKFIIDSKRFDTLYATDSFKTSFIFPKLLPLYFLHLQRSSYYLYKETPCHRSCSFCLLCLGGGKLQRARHGQG